MLQYRLTQETNADFEAEGQSLILHITHDDITYEHQLNPMFDCQKIISNINKFDIEYHNEFINAKYNDTTFRLLPVGENIKVILKLRAEIAELRSKISISTLECKKPVQIFKSNKKAMAAVLDYECIHTHEYPSWLTYEEFTRLPGWKYFKAAENPEKYVGEQSFIERYGKIIKVLTSIHIPTYFGGATFIATKNSYYRQGDQSPFTMYNTNYFDHSFCPLPEHITGILDERSAADYESDPAFYKQYVSSKAAIGIYIPEIIFFKSIKEILTINDSIKHVVFEYIKRYVTGWFLLNIDLFIDRKSYVEIEIQGTLVNFRIYKSIKKYGGIKLGHYKTMCIPLIKKIIINDIIYEI